MEYERQKELELRDDIEILKKYLTDEANSLALPRKILSRIHKYLNEATTMDCRKIVHGFEVIVQRYYDEFEYERRKKNSSSSKSTRYHAFHDDINVLLQLPQ